MESVLDDSGLMEKHHLDERLLQRVFRQLIESQLITSEFLHTRGLMSDTQITRAFLGKWEDIEVPE